MIDVHVPVTDGRELLLTLYTDHIARAAALLLDQLQTSRGQRSRHPKSPPRRWLRKLPAVVKTFDVAHGTHDLNHSKMPLPGHSC